MRKNFLFIFVYRLLLSVVKRAELKNRIQIPVVAVQAT